MTMQPCSLVVRQVVLLIILGVKIFSKYVPMFISISGVLFSSATADNATADNAVYCIIGYLPVQYTTLHYLIMSFLEKCKLVVWVVLTMIKGCP